MDYDKLPKEIQMQLIKLVMAGVPPTPDNQNRAVAALQANPQLVQKLLKQSGLDKDLGDADTSDDGTAPDDSASGGDDTDDSSSVDSMDFGPDPNDDSGAVDGDQSQADNPVARKKMNVGR